MQPRVHVITLGTANIAKARAFYEQLGWKPSSTSNEHFVAFHTHGAVVCLYPESSLAEDAAAAVVPHTGFRGVTLAHNVATKEQVDAILKQAVRAGGKLEKAAKDAFWGGYSGYFSDLDGHFWEVAWNPHWKLKDDGSLQLPE